MQITLSVSDDLADRLRPVEHDLARILEFGIREWHARREVGFAGLADIFEKLASLPTPQEVLDLRPSPILQERIEEILEKNRTGQLMPEEQQEWKEYEFVEHLVRLAKARAALKLG